MRYRGITLDPFQLAAVEAIERHDTVILAAPTGAGKTVVAEYAIERYLEEGRRIIYTAPIKALSNQKFRDFSAAWGERIGIVTGDVSINGTAPVLIMTTEIFRNTIFDEPGRLDDVEYVILDEIHYINDIQRGTVWEESLIFAPQHIGFICLSATIPNLDEFAAWVREVRPGLEVAVIREDQRPVPLEHHLWLPGHGEVKLSDVRRLSKAATNKRGRLRSQDVRRVLGSPAPQGPDLIAHLEAAGRLPCLYFCFSRQACEDNAGRQADTGLLGRDEEQAILALYDELETAFGLTGDGASARLRNLVAGGVAYHHAGMLPLLKEIVERLFASGLLKLLFTTETFAVGVNMPACSVVFESLEKYDGVSMRYLSCREYHQMAGRAGRRGIDSVGYVYARVDPGNVDADEVRHVTLGEVEPTESQFNLSYSSILSLYDQFGEQIFDVCHRSFANYQNLAKVREIDDELAELAHLELPQVDCYQGVPKSIRKYLEAREELSRAAGRAQGERRRLERRHGGSKRQLAAELRQIDRAMGRLQEQIDGSPCHHCRSKKACTATQRQLNLHYEQVDALRRAATALKHTQRDQIARRLALLREFGYVDESGLTSKGRLAATLYGFEVAIAELFFSGFFEQTSELELACLMVAIVFEGKRSTWFAELEDTDLGLYLREAGQLLRQVERREWELGIDNGTIPLDDSLTPAVRAWCDGAELEELRRYTDADGGDLVRIFRHAVDLLRQFRRAVRDHHLLGERIDRVISRLRRDEVDAERQLRLGHALDRSARDRSPVAEAHS